MAELAQIEEVLVCMIAQAVYPDGTAAASATGTPARVYRGWPQPASLDADLADGTANMSVFPLDVERNVTRYPLDWQEMPLPPVHLTLTVSGNSITIGGRVTCPLNAAVKIDGTTYVYPLQATDTPTSVATALSALIPNSTSYGPQLNVPGLSITATVGAVGNVLREIRRQVKSFRISLWCPSPMIRDALAGIVDSALAATFFVNLPDGTTGRLIYQRSHTDDSGQKAIRYRRDLVYSVEYATAISEFGAVIVAAEANINQ